MSWDRRHFLTGGSALAAAGLIQATQAHAAPAVARSVADFGVKPGGGDQTAALQKAIDAIAAAGEAVHIPGGAYQTGPLTLPANCAVTGVPGQTQLFGKPGQPIFEAAENLTLHLFGLTLDGGAERPGSRRDMALVAVKSGDLSVSHCLMLRCPGSAISADGISGSIHAVTVRTAYGPAIRAVDARSLTLSQCIVRRGEGKGIEIATSEAEQGGAVISGNHIVQCATGIGLSGSGSVNANVVNGSARFGIQLGGAHESGVITATGNTIIDCSIGIGVVAGGETILASINLISRAGAAGIRAFTGEKLVGPDLTRESAEAFLNLTVAGNVVR